MVNLRLRCPAITGNQQINDLVISARRSPAVSRNSSASRAL